MKTITEYLQQGHLKNYAIKEIHSSDDLKHGDYFRVEWDYNGENYWVIGRFNKIGIFSQFNINKTVIYDFGIVKTSYGGNHFLNKIQVNGHIGLEKDSKNMHLQYKTITEDDYDLLKEIENHVMQNSEYTKLFNTGDVNVIGTYNEKINIIRWDE